MRCEIIKLVEVIWIALRFNKLRDVDVKDEQKMKGVYGKKGEGSKLNTSNIRQHFWDVTEARCSSNNKKMNNKQEVCLAEKLLREFMQIGIMESEIKQCSKYECNGLLPEHFELNDGSIN